MTQFFRVIFNLTRDREKWSCPSHQFMAVMEVEIEEKNELSLKVLWSLKLSEFENYQKLPSFFELLTFAIESLALKFHSAFNSF